MGRFQPPIYLNRLAQAAVAYCRHSIKGDCNFINYYCRFPLSPLHRPRRGLKRHVASPQAAFLQSARPLVGLGDQGGQVLRSEAEGPKGFGAGEGGAGEALWNWIQTGQVCLSITQDLRLAASSCPRPRTKLGSLFTPEARLQVETPLGALLEVHRMCYGLAPPRANKGSDHKAEFLPAEKKGRE